MQKVDFTRHITFIGKALRSKEILEAFLPGIQSNITNYIGTPLTSVMIDSKSNYDTLQKEQTYARLFKELGASGVYDTGEFSELINILHSRQSSYTIFYNPHFAAFHTLHTVITRMSSLATSVFFEDSPKYITDDLNAGYIILEILQDDTALTLPDFSKILQLLAELLDALSKAANPKEPVHSSRIVLLDSGSSTNLGIQTSVETAKSLFLVFKEIWDWIVNHRHYRNSLENQSLLGNLDVIKQITQHKNDGVLTDDEAKALIHRIKTRTADLLDINVLPKTITDQKIEASHRDILLNYKETKLLQSKDDSQGAG